MRFENILLENMAYTVREIADPKYRKERERVNM